MLSAQTGVQSEVEFVQCSQAGERRWDRPCKLVAGEIQQLKLFEVAELCGDGPRQLLCSLRLEGGCGPRREVPESAFTGVRHSARESCTGRRSGYGEETRRVL